MSFPEKSKYTSAVQPGTYWRGKEGETEKEGKKARERSFQQDTYDKAYVILSQFFVRHIPKNDSKETKVSLFVRNDAR